ncbi:MAG: 30S ribosome-binding factor RbfA [Clostridia bacterium]|nr:30S ribosome-binding factor RbfA [Clostridia bacterium]
MPNIRMSRVDSEIQKAVASIIDARVRDESLGVMISVQNVDTTPDLMLSTIYFSVLGGDSKQIQKYLTIHKSEIRKELAKKIRLKILPDLKFEIDTLNDYAEHMNKLFDSIKGDK